MSSPLFLELPDHLEFGAKGRNRTDDACAFNAALYQLSYPGMNWLRALVSSQAFLGDMNPNPTTGRPPATECGGPYGT